MGASKKIIIIGGGVIGLSTAWYAARRGHKVTVLERGSPTHDSCSLGNAGMIVPSHFIPLAAPGMVTLGLKMMWNPRSPFYIKPRLNGDLLQWAWQFWKSANAGHVARSAPLLRDLSLLSRKCFEEFSRIPGNDFGLVQKGLVMLCKTEHTLAEEASTAARARELGIPADVLDAAQLARLEPGLKMDVKGGVFFPLDCHLSPQRFVAGLTQQLESVGVEFKWETEVLEWNTGHGAARSVKTTCGEIEADEFVIAGGSWSPAICRGLDANLLMQPGKGYSVTLPKAPRLPSICAILTEARVAVTPMGDSLRVGGTMEISGMDESVQPARVEGIVQSIPKYFPEYVATDFAGLPVWKGLRPCTPDGMPYIGRLRNHQNVIAANGHAMMGLSLGPATGMLVSQLISDEKPEIELSLLSPDRFA